ncbi:MAG: hypothetical protein M3388_06885 [Acidobacteriota bacterium]|nr:hypothetical protein [Acidobacteriota bacterium]
MQRDIDKIIDLVKRKFPNTNIEQLKVKFPFDDDGVWYFGLPEDSDDVIQIENSFGKCPFLIETNRNDKRRIGKTIEEVSFIICEHLRTPLKSK